MKDMEAQSNDLFELRYEWMEMALSPNIRMDINNCNVKYWVLLNVEAEWLLWLVPQISVFKIF